MPSTMEEQRDAALEATAHEAAKVVKLRGRRDALSQALVQAIEESGFMISGPTDVRAAEHGEPAWVCNARAVLAESTGSRKERADSPMTYAEVQALAYPERFSVPNGYNGERTVVKLAIINTTVLEISEHGFYRSPLGEVADYDELEHKIASCPVFAARYQRIEL